MDKTLTKLDDYFKSFSTLTTSNGQIRLTPGTENIYKGINPVLTRHDQDWKGSIHDSITSSKGCRVYPQDQIS